MSSDPTAPIADTAEDARFRAYVDSTTRFPVLFFFTSAAVWLVISAFLGFAASVALNNPTLLPRCATWVNSHLWPFRYWVLDWNQMLNFGRSYPAFLNALVYGWAFQAGIGASIWIMARLCRVPLRNHTTLIVAGHIWNIGITLGVLGILTGHGTSIIWLDFPNAVWPLLFIAYMLMTIWMIVMFRSRREGPVYISQHYVLAAFLIFPWLYLSANLLIHVFPSAAVMSAAISAWYSSAVIYLFFVPIGLALSYYLVPKILGRPIYSYQLAKLGLWTLIALGGWTGVQRFLGGPLPSWMPAVSGAAVIFMAAPVVMVVANQWLTVRENIGYMKYSPTLRFTMFGLIGFVLMVVVGSLTSFFRSSSYLQFTLAVDAYEMLGLYWFFSMTMFAAFYFIGPRITGCEWLSRGMIRWHFWFSAYGIITLVAWMLFGGIAMGGKLEAWDMSIETAVSLSKIYMVAQAVAWFLIIISNLMFLLHVGLMCLRLGRRAGLEPTLIHELPEGSSPALEGAKG